MEPWMIWVASAVAIIAIAAFTRWLLRGEAEIDAAIAEIERWAEGDE